MDFTKITVLTGREGAVWELKQAAEWTKNFRDKSPGATVSHFFGREILEKILAQDACMGLRFYNAIDDEGKAHLIISGVAANGEDQLSVSGATKITDEEERRSTGSKPAVHMLAQESMPCPGSPPCPKNALAGGV